MSLLLLGCLSLMAVGCAGSRPTTPIHEAPLGTVFLENVSDTSFQAAHPIKLSETIVADILRGVHTKEKTGLLLLLGKALKSTNLNDIRTFSEDDIAFLTPHLTTALAQATPNQRVGFHIYSQSPQLSQNKETTSGYLFADGLSMHFTLTQYRYNPKKKPSFLQKEPRPLPDTDGLRDREVTFLPESAVRPDVYDRSSWIGKSEDRSLAIDYQLLARVLAAPPPPVPVTQPVPVVTAPAPPSQTIPAQTIPAQAPPIGKQDADLQAFKEEMKALRKKVDEQETELQRLKNSPPKKK